MIKRQCFANFGLPNTFRKPHCSCIFHASVCSSAAGEQLLPVWNLVLKTLKKWFTQFEKSTSGGIIVIDVCTHKLLERIGRIGPCRSLDLDILTEVHTFLTILSCSCQRMKLHEDWGSGWGRRSWLSLAPANHSKVHPRQSLLTSFWQNRGNGTKSVFTLRTEKSFAWYTMQNSLSENRTFSWVLGSIAEVASSNRSTAGWRSTIRARHTSCRSPKLRLLPENTKQKHDVHERIAWNEALGPWGFSYWSKSNCHFKPANLHQKSDARAFLEMPPPSLTGQQHARPHTHLASFSKSQRNLGIFFLKHFSSLHFSSPKKNKELSSKIRPSVYCSKGSRLWRKVPEKSTGSCLSNWGKIFLK